MTTPHEFDPRTHPDGAWITRMFAAVDAQDIEGNAAFMHPQVRFRFGNGPVLQGTDQLAEGQRQLYGSIRGLRHRLVGIWREGNVVTVEAEATYTRLDGEDVVVPVVSLLRLTGPEQVGDYRVFCDLAPVFAPSGEPAQA